MNLTWLDWLVMSVYFAFVLGVGFALKRTTTTSAAFFQAGRAIPAWVCGLAFISANLGAQELIGMAASGAKYGIATSHFYWVGAVPAIVYLGLRDAGGWSGIVASVPAPLTHTWRGFGSAATSPMGVDAFGLAMGLGFVLSFGYWCTDFLVVQRAMAADSMAAARRTPLIAAVPKMLFPFLVILPGLIALSVHGGVVPVKMYEGTTTLVLDSFGKPQLDYDLTIPTLLLRYFPTGMLGLGLTALLASFMSGMAGNVTAFNTVWTYDIYQAYLKPKASDAHYLWIGRMATVFGIAASV